VVLNSAPATAFKIDFYANRECDPSGYGQGELYLGTTTLTTDGAGHAAAGVIISKNIPKTHGVVTATATDPGNNTSEFSKCGSVGFINNPPVAKCHDFTIRTHGTCEAAVSVADLSAGSFDPDGDAPLTITASPPPPYAPGTTSVTITVTDPSGASSTCNATVTVIDADAPKLTCPPNITATAPGAICSAKVAYSLPSAVDNCPGPIAVSCSPPSGYDFPVGTTSVNCTGTDVAGNVGACSFLVTVKGGSGCPELKIISSSASSASGFMELVFETPFFNQNHLVQETADLGQSIWNAVLNAQITPLNQQGLYHARLPITGSPRFYRVIALPNQQ
jgi:hypothetical protein